MSDEFVPCIYHAFWIYFSWVHCLFV